MSNTYLKLTSGDKKLTLGFIGGSITLGSSAKSVIVDGAVVSKDGDIMQSYVNRVSNWFRDTYPDANIETVNAGISDTATNFGIYRLEQNLMNSVGHNMPDLVFVEFTTNDFGYETQGKEEIKIQAESIFRNIWSHNPYAEIVMVSTNVYSASQSIAAYREVCEYYGISFIDVGGPLQSLKKSRGYSAEKSGCLYYTVDNLHPSAKGYEVYFDIIKPVLSDNLIGGAALINHKELLPAPISDKLIDRPGIVKAEELNIESCIVKKDCSKSENMVKYFQESEQNEKESELHKGV